MIKPIVIPRTDLFEAPSFSSFVMGGFECTYAKRPDGSRLDMLAATRHDELCREDYRRLAAIGVRTVREGLSWSAIDRGGSYDFSRFKRMMRIAEEEGIQIIWDLNHFDYPDDLDPFTKEFVRRFARYARAAIRVIRKYQKGTIYIVPWNEISFFSWAAAEEAWWAPGLTRMGWELKKWLVRASIAAMDAMWDADGDVRFIHTDPVMYRKARNPRDDKARAWANWSNEIQFQTWDMISGRICKDLGGREEYLDILGINYYYRNQEWPIKDPSAPGGYSGWGMAMNSRHRISFATLLENTYRRYDRPMVNTETGSHVDISKGCPIDLRDAWWPRVLRQIEDARKAGVPIYGVCGYPAIDFPDWFGGRYDHSGWWDFDPSDPACRRIPNERSLRVVSRYARKHT